MTWTERALDATAAIVARLLATVRVPDQLPVPAPVFALWSATASATATTRLKTSAPSCQGKLKTSGCPRVLRRSPANRPPRPTPARRNRSDEAQTSASLATKQSPLMCSEFVALLQNQVIQLLRQIEKAAAWVSCESGSCRAAALRWTTDQRQEQATFAMLQSTELTTHLVVFPSASRFYAKVRTQCLKVVSFATSISNATLTALSVPPNLIVSNRRHSASGHPRFLGKSALF